MHSRHYLINNLIEPKDLVTLFIGNMPKLSLTDLQLLIYAAEEEIDNRRDSKL